jgi:hypothetical protein
MPREIYYRAGNARNQPVWQPTANVPTGYAEGLGAGPPGKPSANQIRTTIRARLYGTSVAPATDHSRNPKPHRSKGWPPPTPQPRQATRSLDRGSVGSNAGPSAPAYDARPRQRRIVRSQIAG